MDQTAIAPPVSTPRRRTKSGVLAVLLAAGLPLPALSGEAGSGDNPAEVHSDDVTRFFQTFDAAHGKPDAEALRRGYLDVGSDALRDFNDIRIGSMERLAQAIVDKPALFDKARTCATRLPEISNRVVGALAELGTVLPSARFPPVTILVGRGTTGGVTTPAGVVIGLETLCNADWMQPEIDDRFVHLIAHEYVHVQQHGAAVEVTEPTLLYQVLLEGGAEYVGELISGQVANAHLQSWTHDRECTLGREFLADKDGAEMSRWLYNGPGDDSRRGDLGYWIGHRIARAYVNAADDRQQAIVELLDVRPEIAAALFDASGWRPECDSAGAE
ncbi:DUF2268 domain-containing putative Zn-dependent protease [Lysobacter sp. A286]